MNTAVKYILILIFAVVFFEAGVVSTYTIVSGQAPDLNKIIGTQIDQIGYFIKLLQGNKDSSAENIDINNPNEVAQAIQNKSNMDGVSIQTLKAHTNDSTSNDKINVTITVTAYKTITSGSNTTNGSITIKPNETYSITATAIGTTENGGVTIDLNSIVITTIRKLYTNTVNGT